MKKLIATLAIATAMATPALAEGTQQMRGNWTKPSATENVGDIAALSLIGAVAGYMVGGPFPSTLGNVLTGGATGAGIGYLIVESQKNCRYTNTVTGETWRDTCPEGWVYDNEAAYSVSFPQR